MRCCHCCHTETPARDVSNFYHFHHLPCRANTGSLERQTTSQHQASDTRCVRFALTAKGLVSGFFYRFSAKKRTACAYPAPCPMRWLMLHLKEQPSSALLEDLTWKIHPALPLTSSWLCGDQAIADVTAPSLVSPTSLDGVQTARKCPIVGNTEAPCCALDS
jgi:hypothetical protein